MISQDILWKGIIEDFFPQFMDFFYPDVVHQFDLERAEFLDQEFDQLFPDIEGHVRRVDKLVKVPLLEGSEKWILVHLEVQGYYDKDFQKRMFTYAYRIFDRYDMLVEALVIFTDDNPGFKPSQLELKSISSILLYQFRTYKLLEQSREALEASDNPVALALLVAYDEILLGKIPDPEQVEVKTKWLRLLLSKGYDRVMIERLTRFIKNYLPFSDSKMIGKFDQHIIELTQQELAMGIIERTDKELKKIYFEEGKHEGFGEGVTKGKLEGRILASVQILASLRGTGYFSGSANEDIAITFQLPVDWVERIRQGDVPTKEEVEQFVASQHENGSGLQGSPRS